MPAHSSGSTVEVLLLGDDSGQLPKIPLCNFTCHAAEDVKKFPSIPSGFDMAVIVKQVVGDEATGRLHGFCQAKGLKAFNFLAAEFDPDIFGRWLSGNNYFDDLITQAESSPPNGRRTDPPPPDDEDIVGSPPPPPNDVQQPKSGPRKRRAKRKSTVKAGGTKRAAKNKGTRIPKVKKGTTVGKTVCLNLASVGDDNSEMIKVALKAHSDMDPKKVKQLVWSEMSRQRRAGAFAGLSVATPDKTRASSAKKPLRQKTASHSKNGAKAGLAAKVSRNGKLTLADRLDQANVSMGWSLLDEAAAELRRQQLVIDDVRNRVS